MAVGDIILPVTPTRTMTKVKEMASKWGVSTTNITFVRDDTALQSKISTMIGYINSAKSKSGWSGAVSPVPGQYTPIIDIFDALYNQAEAIRVYCRCNCNYCSCDCNYCSCDGYCSCYDGRNQ